MRCNHPAHTPVRCICEQVREFLAVVLEEVGGLTQRANPPLREALGSLLAFLLAYLQAPHHAALQPHSSGSGVPSMEVGPPPTLSRSRSHQTVFLQSAYYRIAQGRPSLRAAFRVSWVACDNLCPGVGLGDPAVALAGQQHFCAAAACVDSLV